MRANLVECSDHDVIYGILTVEEVSIEEVQNKIYEIKNDKKFLEENPEWCIDDVFEWFPKEWEWTFIECEDNTIEI
jgi:hypothetical protein